MRSLYTLLAIITVMVGSAQTNRSNVVTVTPFETSEGSYFHMQGRVNVETNCFDDVTAEESYDIDYQGQGQDIDLFVNDIRYRVVDNDRATINSKINPWSIINEVYLRRTNNVPAIQPNSDLLDCPDAPGWDLAPGQVHWYQRDGDLYDGWAYNPYAVSGGLVAAYLTNQYTGIANNNRYAPGGDLNIHFNNGNGFQSIALLEAAIEGHISAYEGATSINWEAPMTDHRGWRIGASVDGASSYSITDARRFSARVDYGAAVTVGQYHVEASWVYYLTPEINDVSNPHLFIPIVTDTYYIRYIDGVATEFSLEQIQSDFPNDWETRIASTQFTLTYRAPTPDQVVEAHDRAFGWVQDDILRSAVRLARNN